MNVLTILLAMVLARYSADTDLKIQAPEAVDICASSWTPRIDLQAMRPDKVEGLAKWVVVGTPEGTQATIVSGENDTAAVYVRGFCKGAEPDSKLTIAASIGDHKGRVTVTLKRGQAKVLLVDDDRSSNNTATPSKSLSPTDELFRKLLLEGDGVRSLAYDVATVERYSNGPALDVLSKYDTVIWYTAAEYGGNRDNTAVLSYTDLNNLKAFLAAGKSVIIFSPGTINNYQGYVKTAKSNEEQWIKVDNDFFSGPAGLKGGRGLTHRFAEVDVTSTENVKFHLAKGKPVETQISPINPNSARPLFLASLNPDNMGVRPVPCASANVTNHGTVVLVGFSFENIVEHISDAFQIVIAPAVGWGVMH